MQTHTHLAHTAWFHSGFIKTIETIIIPWPRWNCQSQLYLSRVAGISKGHTQRIFLLLEIYQRSIKNAVLWLATQLAICLNNRVFLSKTYWLIVAPRKLDVLKTNMLFLTTSNFQGAFIRPIAPRQTLCCLYSSPLNFPPRASSEIILNYYQLH